MQTLRSVSGNDLASRKPAAATHPTTVSTSSGSRVPSSAVRTPVRPGSPRSTTYSSSPRTGCRQPRSIFTWEAT